MPEYYALYSLPATACTKYTTIKELIQKDMAKMIRFAATMPGRKIEDDFKQDMAQVLNTMVYIKVAGEDFPDFVCNEQISSEVKASLQASFIPNTYRMMDSHKIITIGLSEFHQVSY